jgi:hypothetical protein
LLLGDALVVLGDVDDEVVGQLQERVPVAAGKELRRLGEDRTVRLPRIVQGRFAQQQSIEGGIRFGLEEAQAV